MSNDRLVLISGKSTTGKSASLRCLRNPEGVMYMCTESGKDLPFKHKFKAANVIDPLQVPQAIVKAETMSDIHTCIVDSITYLMDQYESKYVLTATNTMQAWGEYAQFFKRLMQDNVAASTKNIIMTGHTLTTFKEGEGSGEFETCVPIKGSLKNNGIESYFSVVISTKKMKLRDLEKYANPLLTITEEEEILGFKYVFQTKLTKDTVNERIRSPMGMWTVAETFIDNDVQLVIDKLDEYYS